MGPADQPAAHRHRAVRLQDDYIPHHEPFEYYAVGGNPHHLAVPANSSGQDTLRGLRSIGTDTQHFVKGQPQFDTPNHQYDMSDFDQLVSAIHLHLLPASALPGVSFLKAPGFQDGHAAYSDPLDEQEFLVRRSTPWSRRMTGPAPRLSSPTTTPTAGTTMRSPG